MLTKKKTLDEFYTFCLTTCGRNRLKKIEWALETIENNIKKDLTTLKTEDVVIFLSYLNQSNFSAWSKNDLKKIFKRFLKWYYKDLEMVEGNKVKAGFKGVSSRRAFNKEKVNGNTLVKPEELEKLLRTAKSLKWKALIAFAYESAFRPCEIQNLKWKNLKFDETKGICRVYTLSPKTREQRTIPVKDCVLHLKRWKEEYQFNNRRDEDYVFPSQQKRDKPMGNGVISQMFLRLSKEAKIRHIYPYLLRHSRLTELQKRLPNKISSKFAGHSIETSELYNHIDDDDVEETMLKDVYATEEIEPEVKNKMQTEIDDLKAQMKELMLLKNSGVNVFAPEDEDKGYSDKELEKMRTIIVGRRK